MQMGAVRWHVALLLSLRRALDKGRPVEGLIDQLERTKASIRAKVEHPFRRLKQQVGHVKLRYRGSKKNMAQIVTLFALGNPWMAKRKLMACMEQVRVQGTYVAKTGPNSACAASEGSTERTISSKQAKVLAKKPWWHCQNGILQTIPRASA